MDANAVREVLASLRVVTNTGTRAPTDPLTAEVIPTVPIGLGLSKELAPIRLRAEFFKARFGKPVLVPVNGPNGKPLLGSDGTPITERVQEDRIHSVEIPSGSSASTEAVGQLLSVGFLIAPIIEGKGTGDAETAELLLTVTVHSPDLDDKAFALEQTLDKLLNAQGTEGYRQISIPFALPRIGIPAFAIIGTGVGLELYTGGEPNANVLFTPTGSGIPNVDGAVKTISDLLEVLRTLAAFVEFISGLVAPLKLLTQVLPAPEFDIRIGDVPDLETITADADWVDNADNFGDQNGSLLLFAPLNQRLKLWYNDGPSGAARVIKPVPLLDVLNPKAAEAIFVRRQLDLMLQKHGIGGLPEMPVAGTLAPIDVANAVVKVGLVCINDWNAFSVDVDPVLLIKLTPQQRASVKKQFYEFDDGSPMFRQVEALEWKAV